MTLNAPERARRRLLVFALSVAVLFGGLGVASWWSSRDDPRAGSKVVSGGGPALRIRHVPTTYRAVYRVDNRAGGEIVTTTERVWVRRPFQSRIETYTGPPPGTSRSAVRQSAFGVLASRGQNSEPLNIAAPPSLASGDLRIDGALGEAVEDDTILRRERREVFGRECQVYRAGGPVSAGDIERYEPRTGNYADVCVDGNGIVIEEAWVYRNDLIQRRAAVEVEVDPAIDRKLFDIDIPPSEGALRGSVERLDSDADDEGLWVLPETPRGFDALGRYGIVIPQAAVPQTGMQLPGPAPTSTSDVYVRGPDLLVVDQDPSLARVLRQDSRVDRELDLPNLEDARLVVGARTSEIRARTTDGSVVRIFGTLPPPELIELARSLRRQE
ncbi:MAG: hypothetical protein ACRDKJ_00190 [Actinomycetota bacterium]